MLSGKMKQGKQVVTIDDIEEIIKIMGRPEDISGSEEKNENERIILNTGECTAMR